MQWDAKMLELFFSVVFVLVGSFTFHISSVISGTNIFREYPAQFSTLIALTIGTILFGLSPISFLLLGSYLGQQDEAKQAAEISILLSDILKKNTIFPFVLSASGFGLIFGASYILQVRAMFLSWVRKITNMQFGIKSYYLTWDNFLASVKNNGEISVELEKKIIKGHLKSFSIRMEPRAIWLENYNVYKLDSTEQHYQEPIKGEILIRSDDIIQISAPRYSFNKHNESMRHLSQAFYIVLIAIGVMFLAMSINGTANYLDNSSYHGALNNIRDAYRTGVILCLAVAFVLLLTAIKVLREDCSSWRATLDFYYEFLIFIIVLISLYVYAATNMVLTKITFISSYKSLYTIFILVIVATAICYLVYNSRPITKAFRKIIALDGDTEDSSLLDFITEIYTKSDVNETGVREFFILPPTISNKYENFWAMPQIQSILKELIEVRPYLRDDMYNFVAKLRLCLTRSQKLKRSSHSAI